MLKAYGVLSREGSFVEKNALELKGRYVGHTAPRVKDAIQQALGGCLFLDEAYALAAAGGSDSFSNEAVRTLLTEVENNRSNVLVVLAGYKDKMATLLQADPGLPRRFPHSIHLDDYTPLQLGQIASQVATRYEMILGDGVDEALADHIGVAHAHEIKAYNGGLAVRLVEEAITRMATRCGANAAAITNVLCCADFGIIAAESRCSSPLAASDDLSAFICPITHAVMRDPVVDSEGNSYERAAIEKWLRSHGSSPVTRSPLCGADLRPNRALKDMVARVAALEQQLTAAAERTARSEASRERAEQLLKALITAPITAAEASRVTPRSRVRRLSFSSPCSSPVCSPREKDDDMLRAVCSCEPLGIAPLPLVSIPTAC
eukprot:SAG11_NODE_3474_length_2426_cov_1.681564_2_plen_376_part_00